VHVGDVLVLYGREELVDELDDRPAGPEGDLAHAAAVARYLRTIQVEQDADHASRRAS
jgi:hypothetical protein